MTKNDIIEALADYYELDYPKMDDNGNYRLYAYDWQIGGSMGNGCRKWLTLANVVEALESICDDDE